MATTSSNRFDIIVIIGERNLIVKPAGNDPVLARAERVPGEKGSVSAEPGRAGVMVESLNRVW